MRTNDGQQAIALEKVARGPIGVKGAAAHVVVHQILCRTFLPAETEGVHHRRAGPVCAFPQ